MSRRRTLKVIDTATISGAGGNVVWTPAAGKCVVIERIALSWDSSFAANLAVINADTVPSTLVIIGGYAQALPQGFKDCPLVGSIDKAIKLSSTAGPASGYIIGYETDDPPA